MSDKPGRQQLTGYALRDYDHALAALVKVRETKGISLAALGNRIGLTAQSLAWNLRGKHRMDGAHLFRAFDALGYDLALIPREDA